MAKHTELGNDALNIIRFLKIFHPLFTSKKTVNSFSHYDSFNPGSLWFCYFYFRQLITSLQLNHRLLFISKLKTFHLQTKKYWNNNDITNISNTIFEIVCILLHPVYHQTVSMHSVLLDNCFYFVRLFVIRKGITFPFLLHHEW